MILTRSSAIVLNIGLNSRFGTFQKQVVQAMLQPMRSGALSRIACEV